MELYRNELDTQSNDELSAGLRAALLALPYQDDDGVIRGTLADHLAKRAA